MAISWPADFNFWKLQKREFKKFLQHNASNKNCLKIHKIGPKSGSSKMCLVASFFRENDAFIRLQQVVSKLKLDCNKMPAASMPLKKNNSKIFRAFSVKIDVEAMLRRLWAGPQKHQNSFAQALTAFDLLTVKSEKSFLLMRRR